jgi:hypothetical protein
MRQIENERIFSIAGILTAGKRSTLGMEVLGCYMEIYKNYPDDPLFGLTALLDCRDGAVEVFSSLGAIAVLEAELCDGDESDLEE